MENPSANKSNKNMPPPGYPTGQTMQPETKPVRPQTQARGEKGFVEGCIILTAHFSENNKTRLKILVNILYLSIIIMPFVKCVFSSEVYMTVAPLLQEAKQQEGGSASGKEAKPR
ncbi:cysteine-rich and transmembrane domain-containing protein A [Carex littledalei]|uniref:Cysteine-rich and transmembrane domain-containing protein A n=1 Tax=Carex littledalei TaxID=544730 RepID=A0A833VXR1_9POAL|nr:cysteine-rich and transmembrane domain-containing protein A [Carex littledalei]